MMTRVLIVKISSMGDLVHALPALTDATKAIPGIRFDWVVERAFSEVPSWHPGVEHVISSSHRLWRKNLRQMIKNNEGPGQFLKKLREKHYDFVIDAQAELKSAIITRLAKGLRCSYDRRSVHEWGAQFAYQKKYYVPKHQHALKRMRQLFADILGYTYAENELDYAIDRARLPAVAFDLPKPYLIFIHSTSWDSKCWPVPYWQALIAKATAAGFSVLLPWGNEQERQRSFIIAANNPKVMVLPKLNLSEKTFIISHAHATVGCDTGLSHIAAALEIPSVTLYGATDPFLSGTIGKHQVHMVDEFECLGCHQRQCTYKKEMALKPACFVNMLPERVWRQLQQLMDNHSCN